jgi:anti-sigma factor RsiW
MTRETAAAVWGAEAVDRALADPEPAPVTAELAAEVRRRADPPGAFRAWSLAQPWPRFCTIVRIVSGAYREEVMAAAPEGERKARARRKGKARR